MARGDGNEVGVPLQSASEVGRVTPCAPQVKAKLEPAARRARSDAPYLLIQIRDGGSSRFWGDVHCSNEYCAAFNHKVGGLNVAKKATGGFEDNGASALNVGDEFAADFGAAQLQRFIPSE